MTEILFFQNLKTGKKYRVVSLDAEKNIVRLQGPTREFNQPYDRDHFKRMGYKLVKVEEADVS